MDSRNALLINNRLFSVDGIWARLLKKTMRAFFTASGNFAGCAVAKTTVFSTMVRLWLTLTLTHALFQRSVVRQAEKG